MQRREGETAASNVFKHVVCCFLLLKSHFLSLCEGKQVIHPGQVQAVQEEFSPSPDRVQWATELIAAFDQHQKEGKVKHFFNHNLSFQK